MESRRTVQIAGAVFCVLLIVSEICCYPPQYSPEDYEQGVRQMIEELERQGLTGPIEPRAYHPGHRMMRKSQRSSNLRLRFGKRSSPPFDLEVADPIGNPNWKQCPERRLKGDTAAKSEPDELSWIDEVES